MKTEDIISRLSHHEVGQFPRAALQAAADNPQVVTPILLAHLQNIIEKGDDLPADCNVTLVFFAAFLLAQFREPQALPLMVKMVSAKPATVNRLLGYAINEGLARILASMMADASDSAIEMMAPLIESEHVHPQVRYAALSALMVLAAHHHDGFVDNVRDYFQALYQDKLSRTKNVVWDGVVLHTMIAGLTEFESEVLKAYDEGLLVDRMLTKARIQTMLSEHPGEIQAPAYLKLTYMDDCVKELASWASFCSTRATSSDDASSAESAKQGVKDIDDTTTITHVKRPWPARKPVQSKWPIGEKNTQIVKQKESSNKKVAQPHVREGVKVGRNDPCICGSGRKYKKCCG